MRLVAVAALIACVAGAPRAAAQDKTTPDAPAAPVSRAAAVELYTANCQICHGPSGTGTALVAGSAFVGRKWKHGTRIEDVVHTITNGVPGTMMLPFKGKLSPEQITALAALVRSYDKTLKPAGVRK
jgi:mono/diheme cytochrome c family protein